MGYSCIPASSHSCCPFKPWGLRGLGSRGACQDAMSISLPAVRREGRSRNDRIVTSAMDQTMTRVRVHNFTISLDGYGAGPRQTREEPLGVGGEALHDWFIPTRAFQRITGKTGGTTGPDDEIAARFGVGVIGTSVRDHGRRSGPGAPPRSTG